MAWPELLTADEQAAAKDFGDDIASFSHALGVALALGSEVAAKWGGGLSTIIGDLQSDDVVPKQNSRAGSQPLTAGDITNLSGYAINISNPTNASQGTGGYYGDFIHALIVKASGINA